MHLLNQREAAAFLRLSERTLERFRLTGDGPRFAKAGRRVASIAPKTLRHGSPGDFGSALRRRRDEHFPLSKRPGAC